EGLRVIVVRVRREVRDDGAVKQRERHLVRAQANAQQGESVPGGADVFGDLPAAAGGIALFLQVGDPVIYAPDAEVERSAEDDDGQRGEDGVAAPETPARR